MKGAIDEAVVEARELVRRYPDYAPGYYALGWVATRKGDWDEAVTQFGNAITQFGQATELDPKFADAHTSLGYALQRKGLPDQAIAAYHRAIRLKPDSALTHSNLGWSLISKGLADEAITSFRKAIELDPKYAPAYEGLGNALRSQEKLDEAIAEYRQATELDPKYGSAHRQLCDALRNQGKLEEARVVWERALESDPPDHDAWYGYAELCLFLDNEDAYRRNRTALLQRFGKTTDPVVAERTSRACLSLAAAGEELEQAVALADRAVTLGQDHEYYKFFMAAKALAEYRLGRCESALDWGKKAVERGVSIPTHLVLAMAHQRLGHAENARRSLVDGLNSHDWDKSSDGIMRALRREAEGLIAHLPAFLDGWYEPRATPAGELLKRGLIDEAASEARAIIRDHPDSAPPYFTLGQVASIKSEWDKAIAKFSKALELDPEFAEAHAGVGNALEKKGLLDQAIDAYRQAIRVKPDFALAHHNLGLVLDRQGLPHEAFEAYLQALRLEPGNAERRHRIDQAVHSLNNMAWGLATNPDPALRDASRAVKLAKEAVELRPENGAIWNTLGIAHYRTNNCEEAIAALEESIKLRNGGDGYDWFFLAMAHWQLGHREEARKWYDRAVGWFDAPGWHDKDVPRFHVEAAELLGVDDDYVRIARARLHICHSRWEQAAGEYASVTNLLPIRNCDVWSEHACLRLLVNDNEGYRQFCRQVIDHAGRTDDPFTAFVLARACAVSAEPVVEPERLVGWARQAADAEPMAPGRLHILGLAYYRAGKFESAVECADRSAKAGWQNSAEGALNELVLALSHHRMGHTAEARTWLAKARKRVEQFTPAAALLSQVPSPDWVEIQLLRLEAEELLKTE
jgi:tetratricopeptide (TPR) repeat protein